MSPVRLDPGLQAGPSSSTKMQGHDEASRLRMEAFRAVKPTCVALMSLNGTPPTPTSQHARHLSLLLKLLEPLPQAALTQSMINYVLFPLTQILRSSNPATLPENFLEAAFRLLAFVVDKWKLAEGGMDTMAWEQLWRFTVASVGSPAVKGKGKAKEVGQEVHLEAVSLLQSLLESDGNSFPTEPMQAGFGTAKSPLLSTLFQTISYLLSHLSPSPPHRQLQLVSLRLLRPLVAYLRGQHPVLASLLPGIVSGVAKVVANEGKSINGDAAEALAALLSEMLLLTLADTDLEGMGILHGRVDDLSQLAEDWDRGPDPLGKKHSAPSSPTPSTASTSSTRVDPFPPLTASYLDFTSAQLYQAIPPILVGLTAHPSDRARSAASALAATIIEHNHRSLPQLTSACLRTLLLLSGDDFDPVRFNARKRLRLVSPIRGINLSLVDILSAAMTALPRLITSGQDEKVIQEAKIIIAIAEAIQFTNGSENPIAALLGPSGRVERWSWALLDCLEFGRPAGWSASNSAARAAQLGWVQSATAGLIEPAGGVSEQDLLDFPIMPLRYIESTATLRIIRDMLQQLGQAGGSGALHSVEYFLTFARNRRSTGTARAVSALWSAEKLLAGVALAEIEGDEGKVGRKTRKMAKDAVKIVVSIDEDEDDEEDAFNAEDRNQREENPETAVIERGKGINAITTLLDRPIPKSGYIAGETRRLHAAAQHTVLTCRSLSILALSARILSSSFRPLLLYSLYTVLSHMASPQLVVREHAEIALGQIAYHSGYAAPRNLILDNVDYLINVVSQRLMPARLSVHAPLVLIAMIRLVGSEIVPLVHDVVDEIFDALDSYHGYETLASSLLAVLVTLLEVMAADTAAEGLSEERRKKIEELRRVDKPPNPARDFERFKLWYRERQTRRDEEIAEIIQRAPQQSWSKLPGSNEDTAEEAEQEQPQDDADIPLTRAQEVCKQILEKSIYYLSHRNPFLRSRVLALISAAIPVLASGNREGDLLPLIDRGWNVIITRLSDTEGYVVTAAAEVIASLAEHTGDFMSRRILDHAWPKFQLLLQKQQQRDQYSALVRTGGPAGGSSTQSSFTDSHRLHIAILKAMKWVAAEVPVDDKVVWGMMVLFRPFLDHRSNPDLRQAAREMYLELGQRDGDALYVVLQNTAGRFGPGENGIWAFLHEPGLDISLDP